MLSACLKFIKCFKWRLNSARSWTCRKEARCNFCSVVKNCSNWTTAVGTFVSNINIVKLLFVHCAVKKSWKTLIFVHAHDLGLRIAFLTLDFCQYAHNFCQFFSYFFRLTTKKIIFCSLYASPIAKSKSLKQFIYLVIYYVWQDIIKTYTTLITSFLKTALQDYINWLQVNQSNRNSKFC